MLTISLTLSFLLVSAPAPAEGPKPVVEIVQVDAEGRPFVGVLMTQFQVVPFTTFDDQQRPITGFKVMPVEVTTPFYLDTTSVQVYNRAGKRLSPAEVRKSLGQGEGILLSPDGNRIDPRHVARMPEGQVLVVSPSLLKLPKKENSTAFDLPPLPQGL
jgi:hypothetical protein